MSPQILEGRIFDSSSEAEGTTINSWYINQDARGWGLTPLLNDWDPSSLITPTTLSGTSFQVLTAVYESPISGVGL